DYTGDILADYEKEGVDDTGHLIGLKGRTANSVEILLSGMTIGHGFHPEDSHFDENREKIINNSILWAIDHTSSYAGEVRGTVMNDLNEPVQASVTVEETGKKVATDNEGEFFLGLPAGTYTLELEAFGHQSASFTVKIEDGETLEKTFVLESESVGRLNGEIRSQATGDLIEGAKIEVIDTELSTESDESGRYSLTIPEGKYDIRIMASGYHPEVYQVDITQGKTTDLDVSLANSEEVALVASGVDEERMTGLLEELGYIITSFDRDELDDVQENIEDLALIIMNDSALGIDQDDYVELIDAADEARVSMLFGSQFGGGAINDLRDYLNDPESTSQSYAADYVSY